MWRQRLRWFKGGHLFVINKDSIFWRRQQNVSTWQKAMYFVGPMAHVINIWADPILFSMPFVCLVGNVRFLWFQWLVLLCPVKLFVCFVGHECSFCLPSETCTQNVSACTSDAMNGMSCISLLLC